MRELPEEILFDSRLVERHIREGLVTRADYEEWLGKQPDVSERADVLDIAVPSSREARRGTSS